MLAMVIVHKHLLSRTITDLSLPLAAYISSSNIMKARSQGAYFQVRSSLNLSSPLSAGYNVFSKRLSSSLCAVAKSNGNSNGLYYFGSLLDYIRQPHERMFLMTGIGVFAR